MPVIYIYIGYADFLSISVGLQFWRRHKAYKHIILLRKQLVLNKLNFCC